MSWEGGHSIKKMSNHDLLVVAGAGDFIGGHLVKKLREDGFEKNTSGRPKTDLGVVRGFRRRGKSFFGPEESGGLPQGNETRGIAPDMGGMGFIDDCVKGTRMIMESDFAEPIYDQMAAREPTLKQPNHLGGLHSNGKRNWLECLREGSLPCE
jgi:hypothetical protein